jgi:hypothetical protein
MRPIVESTFHGALAGEVPHLRLVDSSTLHEDTNRQADEWPRQTVSPRPTGSCVLIAGRDEQCRLALRQELGRTLAPDTMFIEASEAWEVLQQAPSSRMVMLTGDLREVSAKSITRVLGRRHPSLPVLTLGENPLLQTHGTQDPRVLETASV